MKLFERIGFALALAVQAAAPARAQGITGAGSTFVFPVLTKWSVEYAAKVGPKVKYQSVGSGASINQIKAATVDFGASDAVEAG